VAAGRRNRQLRGPLSDEGRARLRAAALRHRPWESATGPTSAAGKAQAARNGKVRQRDVLSVREVRRELAEVRRLIAALRSSSAATGLPRRSAGGRPRPTGRAGEPVSER
jgi:hypothetical protein